MKTLSQIRDELAAEIEQHESELDKLRQMLDLLDGKTPAPKRAPRAKPAAKAKPGRRRGRPPRVTIAQVETAVRGLGEFTPVQLADQLGVKPSTAETKLREMRKTFGHDLFDVVQGTGPTRTLKIRDLALTGAAAGNGTVGSAS